jgi:hypothetical protein
MINFLELWSITHYHLNGKNEVNIEFTGEDGVACYDSQDDSHHWENWILILEWDYH